MSSPAIESEINALDRIVILAPGGAPEWARTLMDGQRIEAVDTRGADGLLRERLSGTSAVIIDSTVEAPLSLARLAHRITPTAQLVIVARRLEVQNLNRSMMFTPGIGEVWVVAAEEMSPDLFARAAEVGAKRRLHSLRSATVSKQVGQPKQPPERPLIMADQYLAVLLGLLPEPVLALGEDDGLLFRNPAAAGVLRLGREERIDGGELRRRLAPTDPSALDDLLERARGGVARVELRLGEALNERTYDAVAAPVQGERPVRVLVLHDVTAQVHTRNRLEEQAIELEQQKEMLQYQNEELQAQAEELEMQTEELAFRNEENERLAAARADTIAERDRAMERLEASARERSRFYASMSHELRTPLNAIIGYNDLVRTEVYGPLGERQREPLLRVDRAAKHLLDLVNDVLDLSKLEAGKLVLEPGVVDLEEFIADLTATMGPLAEEHDVDLRCDTTGCVGSFPTDPRRLRQIVINLLSNAIRYGAGAPVEVRCGWTEDRLRLEVADRGPGIATEHQEAIFQEFVQVGEGVPGGTGLGLAIARTLARQMGGDVYVRSVPGDGSVFSLELPPMSVVAPEAAALGG